MIRVDDLKAGHVVALKGAERVVADVTRTSARYYRITWSDGTTTRRGPRAELDVVAFSTQRGRYSAMPCSDPDEDGVTDWAIEFRPHGGEPGTLQDIATFVLYGDGLVEVNSRHYELSFGTSFEDALREAAEHIERNQAWLAHRGIPDDGHWMWGAMGSPWLSMPGSWEPPTIESTGEERGQ